MHDRAANQLNPGTFERGRASAPNGYLAFDLGANRGPLSGVAPLRRGGPRTTVRNSHLPGLGRCGAGVSVLLPLPGRRPQLRPLRAWAETVSPRVRLLKGAQCVGRCSMAAPPVRRRLTRVAAYTPDRFPFDPGDVSHIGALHGPLDRLRTNTPRRVGPRLVITPRRVTCALLGAR